MKRQIFSLMVALVLTTGTSLLAQSGGGSGGGANSGSGTSSPRHVPIHQKIVSCRCTSVRRNDPHPISNRRSSCSSDRSRARPSNRSRAQSS